MHKFITFINSLQINHRMKVLYINFTEKVSGGETSLLYYLEELKKEITPVVLSPKKGEFSERLNALYIKNYTFSLNFLSKRNPVPFFTVNQSEFIPNARNKVTNGP